MKLSLRRLHLLGVRHQKREAPTEETRPTSRRQHPYRDVFQSAGRYILSRQTNRGGFCFYRAEHVEEPNLFDTYHAVKSLQLLGVPIPHEEQLLGYLHDNAIVGNPALYYYAFALKALGRLSSMKETVRFTIGSLRPPALANYGPDTVTGWLRSNRIVLRLQHEFATMKPHQTTLATLESLGKSGGYGKKPNIEETADCLYLRDLLGDPDSRPKVREFVDSLQLPSFGFTVTQDSVQTGVHVVYAGMWCCKMLRVPVRYHRDALEFAAACQSRGGGFSRMPDSLPDIETTHRALSILATAA